MVELGSSSHYDGHYGDLFFGCIVASSFDSGCGEENDGNNFNSWDEDGNGSLDEDEMRQGTYNTWDENNDNRIGDDEYNSYLYDSGAMDGDDNNASDFDSEEEDW